jgi:hypothetical protein
MKVQADNCKNMDKSKMLVLVSVLVLVLLLAGCVSGNGVDHPAPDDHFFLKEIFNKYGDSGVITFEVRMW